MNYVRKNVGTNTEGTKKFAPRYQTLLSVPLALFRTLSQKINHQKRQKCE